LQSFRQTVIRFITNMLIIEHPLHEKNGFAEVSKHLLIQIILIENNRLSK